MTFRLCTALSLIFVVLLAACEPAEQPLTAEQIALNNEGAARMGYFDYPAAHESFTRLVEQRPDWNLARVNLAIATLNRQQEGDEEQALALVDQVLIDEPNNLRAAYVAGLLRLYVGQTEQAVAHFSQVTSEDPDDAYAAYYLGQALLQEERAEDALAQFVRAIELDPYLRSAYYGAAQIQRRLGDRDAATGYMRDYQRFEDNPRARLAEFKYTRMGPKAEAQVPGIEQPVTATKPKGPVFGEAQAFVGGLPGEQIDPEAMNRSFARLGLEWSAENLADIAATVMSSADIDGDDEQDLFFGGPGYSTFVSPHVDKFDADYPLQFIKGIVAALWGDIDNDGLLDVYFCRDGENQLWRQVETGVWRADTQAPLDNPYHCAGGAVFDADHDGDLDYFIVNRDGPNALLNNNLDGTFRELAADQGLDGPGEGGVQVLVTDLDSDRDTDIIVLHDNAPNEVFINDRLWEYRQADDMERFVSQPLLAAVAGDLDADGSVELYGVTPDGALLRWRRDDDGAWTVDQLEQKTADTVATLLLQDFDGDGRADMLWRRSNETRLLSIPDSGQVEELAQFDLELVSFVTHLDDVRRGPSLVTFDTDGYLRLHPPGPGRFDFVAMRFTGKEEAAESMRSNRSGIGTQVALRHGLNWSVASTFSHDSSPGQSLQPLAMGLAGAEAADYAEINWSDGVFQTEIDLQAGELYQIEETQRQLSSCPVLFAWDGMEYRFVSDILGVGGLGFMTEPGQVATPRPWEYFLLPQGLLAEEDGRYKLKLTEPMEENAYLDQARLHTYDLPTGWSLVMDERMGTGAPDVTGRPLFYRNMTMPARAYDQSGDDVTESVSIADHKAAPLPELDKRFIGRLSEEHVLTLEFGAPLSAPVEGAMPVLVADGWVEYPYSQTVFAAWQAGEQYTPPSLEYRDADGEWQMLHAQFGYPAGMPRKMALPLATLPEGVDALRLSGNIEVYWDRIGIVWAETPPEISHTVVDLADAQLSYSGFPLRSTGPQHLPEYQYAKRSPFWDTRYLTGYYSEFGPVTELVTENDDALAILGPGEEIHMEFQAPAAPGDGWQRWLVLEARGYAKDMDLYTRDGETVGPLPASVAGNGDKSDAARSKTLHSRYNTRFQSGH